MVAHWSDLLVTGLLATVSVASVCGQVFTKGVLVQPGTQNNKDIYLVGTLLEFFNDDLLGLYSTNSMNFCSYSRYFFEEVTNKNFNKNFFFLTTIFNKEIMQQYPQRFPIITLIRRKYHSFYLH